MEVRGTFGELDVRTRASGPPRVLEVAHGLYGHDLYPPAPPKRGAPLLSPSYRCPLSSGHHEMHLSVPSADQDLREEVHPDLQHGGETLTQPEEMLGGEQGGRYEDIRDRGWSEHW